MRQSTPSKIGPYEVTREIGCGGMGVVYLARDTKLDHDVTIKALPPEVFNSLSTAAGVIAGGNMNGWKQWMDEQKRRLTDVYRSEDA